MVTQKIVNATAYDQTATGLRMASVDKEIGMSDGLRER